VDIRRSGRSAQGVHSVMQFGELLETRVNGFVMPTDRTVSRSDRDLIRSLGASVNHPLAKPLFLRGLDSSHIASITYGAFWGNVLMYLDWDAFGRLFGKAGGEFRWGSPKEARRAKAMNPRLRPPLIRGRLPQIRAGGAVAWITDPALIEMFYDGITPWTVAQNTVEHMHHILKEHGGRSKNCPKG